MTLLHEPGWNRRVWRLAGPIIISNITVPLLGAVDTAVVGHLPDPRYLGGVAIGALIFTFVYWAFGFLRMGTTGLTAQAWGAEDPAEILATLGRALLVAIILAGGILLLQGPIGLIAFQLLNASAEVEEQGAAYFAVRIWGAPAALANFALLGWFLGLQDARWPLVLQVFINSLNIALDILFVVALGWGVEGVAGATVIAEFAGLALGLSMAFRRLRRHGSAFSVQRIFDRDKLWRLVAVNGDIFVRTVFLMFSFAYFTDRSATLGDVILAANAVLMNLVSIAAYGLDGFAHAVEALVGGAAGRRDRVGLSGAVRAAAIWAGLVALGMSAVYAVAGGLMIDIMTGLPEVRNAARDYLPWAVAAPIVSVWCYLYDGIFLGATRTRELRNAAIASTALFLGLVWILLPLWGNHGLWLALIVFNVIRALSLAAYYPRLTRGLAI